MLCNSRNELTHYSDHILVIIALQILNKERWDLTPAMHCLSQGVIDFTIEQDKNTCKVFSHHYSVLIKYSNDIVMLLYERCLYIMDLASAKFSLHPLFPD